MRTLRLESKAVVDIIALYKYATFDIIGGVAYDRSLQSL